MIGKKNTVKINDVMMYIAVALEHLRLMILLMCFSLLLGLTFYCFSRSVYYSRSLIRIRTTPEYVDSQAAFHDSSRASILAQLKSDHLIEATAKRLGVPDSEAIIREINKKYLKKMSIDFDSDNNVVLEIWPYSYEWAEKFPVALVKEFLIHREEKRFEKFQNFMTTIRDEEADMNKKLDEVFDSRWQFEQTNDLMKLDLVLNDLLQVPRELKVINHHLSRMDETRAEVNKATNTTDKLSLLASLDHDTMMEFSKDLRLKLGDSITPEGNTNSESDPAIVIVPQDLQTGDAGWERSDAELRQIRQEVAEKSKIYLPKHREIRERQKKMEAIQAQLDAQLQQKTNAFELEYQSLLDRRAALEAKLPDYAQAQHDDSKLHRNIDMFDAAQLPWATYLNEIHKMQNTFDYGMDRERSDLEWVDFLEPVKDVPSSPNRGHVLVVSFLFGLSLAIAVPFLIAYLDNSIADIEDAESSLRIRGLGVVPLMDEDLMNNLLVANISARPVAKPEYHLQENFRIIRTNLVMNSKDPTMPQVILVTSAMPMEGKTVVAANLAMSFATKGERTLLLDGDLRRGRMHRVFGCQNKPGLSDVLSKYSNTSEACRPSANANLTVMTCGKHLNWASELLDSPGYPKVIADLRSQYQRIIIDSPPILGLSETAIMQRYTDGVLLVIWSHRTQLPNVRDALLSLQTNGAKLCGFVLNRLDFSGFSNRYKYFYYSPRYYTNYKAIDTVPAGDENV